MLDNRFHVVNSIVSYFVICFFILTLYFGVNPLRVWRQTAECDAGGKKQVCRPRGQCAHFSVSNDRLAQQQLPPGTSLTQTHSISVLKTCTGREGGLKRKKRDLCLCHVIPSDLCLIRSHHIGSRWSSRSSASSSRGSAGTSRYAEASSRLRERHTKSQPSWKSK